VCAAGEVGRQVAFVEHEDLHVGSNPCDQLCRTEYPA
jgi:hypothetical protein